MTEITTIESNKQTARQELSCSKPFLLCELNVGQPDKLGHKIEEILWIGQQYAVYRSERGVYVQFSDCPDIADQQRNRFMEISSELCELRYLTNELRSIPRFRIRSKRDAHPSYLFDHNMAQALMLIMEGQVAKGKRLTGQTLTMAVQRVTNDNTALYFAACFGAWITSILLGFMLWWLLPHDIHNFSIAAISGATGAMLSVATRLQSFKLEPCQQSNMNYLMSITRVGIGFIAGPLLVLLAATVLREPMRGLLPSQGWEDISALGFIGGFAERLVPILLQKTVDTIDSSEGTPMQAIRHNVDIRHNA